MRYIASATWLSLALVLAACGGGDDDGKESAEPPTFAERAADSPTGASVEDFCEAAGATEGTAESVAEEMVSIGTPDDVPDDARSGFVFYLDALNDEGSTDVSEITLVEVSEDEKADGEAFVSFLTETCADYFASSTP